MATTLPGGRAASAPLLGHGTEPTLFEMSVPGRTAFQLRTTGVPATPLAEIVPPAHLNPDVVPIAEVSERDSRTASSQSTSVCTHSARAR
jgi:hypothetical protein